MTTTSAAERAAALRAEYARLGENVDHLSDLDLLNREVERVASESRRHQNAYSALLQDQVKKEQSCWAAARRASAEDRSAWAGMYLGHLVRLNAHQINGLIHRAAQLPDGRVPVEVARALKEAAQQAKWSMSGVIGGTHSQLDGVRRQSEEIRLVEKQRDEIWRLRQFITELGQRLHVQHGGKGSRENGWRCECSGCELIRAMDDVPVERDAEIATPTTSAVTAA
ncbi:hypothetical protein [Streptomyces ziwulingensis]|uniref:Uncharacterized protein n=1 Tax=Streptomyces ziwulingensis TaxID=1045501 RepID=A0ABP9D3B3_9ACTN